MHFATRLKPTIHLIDMTPLVDVIFLLLIFFIVTSDTLPFKSLSVSPPKLPVSDIPLTSQIVATVDAQEVIYVGSKKIIVELSTFKEYLQHEIQRYYAIYKKDPPSIVLNIDRKVSYETFLQIFYAAQQTGVPIRLAYHSDKDAYAASQR